MSECTVVDEKADNKSKSVTTVVLPKVPSIPSKKPSVNEVKKKQKTKKTKKTKKNKTKSEKPVVQSPKVSIEMSPSQETIHNKKIIEGLKLYKTWEQREKDLRDSKIGLEPWQMGDLSNEEKKFEKKFDLELDVEDEDFEDLLDEELIELLKQQDVHELEKREYLSFGVLWAIIDFIHSYDSFQYTLIKLALTTSPSLITQIMNEKWYVPKDLKEDLTVYVKDLDDKYKRIIPKKPKVKKEKKKKEKLKHKEKVKKEKKVKEKKKKLTKAEKKELKLQAKLLKKQLQEEEERRLKEEMNKLHISPLQDAELEDEFFKTKFKNFKKIKLKKAKKGKKK